jgi:hypothetical protein
MIMDPDTMLLMAEQRRKELQWTMDTSRPLRPRPPRRRRWSVRAIVSPLLRRLPLGSREPVSAPLRANVGTGRPWKATPPTC